MSQLSVNIMGQPYTLACKEGEEKALQEAVSYLDGKMSAIRDDERSAALGIAAELLGSKAPAGPLSDLTMSEVKQNISAMHTVLDEALAAQEDLF